MILVDTSVLIDLFRGRSTPAADHLRGLLQREVEVAIPEICGQEVLQGARNDKEWQLLSRTLATQELVAPLHSWVTHQEAARIFFDGRREGLTIRSAVDCFIAQLALEREAILLHDDRDFEVIARLRPLRLAVV